MTHRYVPELHDPIHTEMNQKWRRTDREVAEEMGFDISTIKVQRARLGLPVNLRPRTNVGWKQEAAAPLPKEKPNPLEVAARVLGARLVVKESGFWLDNQPASMDTVMRAGNAALKRHGLDQVGVQRWRVE